MAFVGYARVSSVGQSLDVQLEKLQQCDKVFHEKLSGTSSKRPRLKACLEYVREGITLVITRLDRLARSTLDLCCQHRVTLSTNHRVKMSPVCR
ncbi:MAG: recombinase family protein [Candidatus Promineofilum sp.]|nr:recombinase family protein [Promineifilum sp.]